MSAIWGIISRNEKPCDEAFSRMTDVMSQYKIDRIDTIHSDNSNIGCGHQYITNESLTDVSPINDTESNLIFATDCFLYYRDKLVDEIIAAKSASSYAKEDLLKKGDAELSYIAFKTFGYSFVTKLRGAFSLAILDNNTGKLHLYTDHFCKRYLCYHINDDSIIFGTTYKPLLAATNRNFRISTRSIVNFYSTMSPLNFREPENTIFEDVYHLDASMHYTIDVKNGTVAREQYWTPRKSVKKLKGLTDDEYKNLFVETYRNVSEAHLRSRSGTGIMLSGGLDSSSVLAMTAPLLKSQGKKIYSYTTTPSTGFKPVINYNMVEDETFLIYEQKKYHDNLEPRFINGDGDNCIDYLDKYQEYFNIPVKAAINTSNVIKMSEAAVKDNCLILLSGSNGNASVSYGYATTYAGLAMSKGHFIRAIREVSKYCKLCGFSRKKMFKDYLKDTYNYLFKTANIGQYFISKENRDKYNINGIMKQEKHELGSAFHVNERQKRNYMYIPMQYIQKSLYYTDLSLQYGYLQLDPTLTVEIVELCLSLPDECFVHNGIERRLIRDYMRDLLPPMITDMRKGYGVQASDFNYRINRDWPRIKNDVMDVLKDPILLKYMDEKELSDLISDIERDEGKLSWNTAWFMTTIASLGYFLRGHKDML